MVKNIEHYGYLKILCCNLFIKTYCANIIFASNCLFFTHSPNPHMLNHINVQEETEKLNGK